MSISDPELHETYVNEQPPRKIEAEEVMFLGQSLVPVKTAGGGNKCSMKTLKTQRNLVIKEWELQR